MNGAFRLTAAVAILMLLQSSLGLLYRGQYRDVDWIAATWLGNDWVTLVVALPMLAAGAALNVFFPLYLGAVITAALALILGLSRIFPTELARGFNTHTPVRLIGGYFVLVGVSLSAIWLAMWGAYVFAGRPTPVHTEAFKLVAALDTVLMAPSLSIGGVLLWRRRAWGYVIAAIAGVQASLYLLVLSLNALIAASSEFLLWCTLAVMTSAAAAALLANAAPANPRTYEPHEPHEPVLEV